MFPKERRREGHAPKFRTLCQGQGDVGALAGLEHRNQGGDNLWRTWQGKESLGLILWISLDSVEKSHDKITFYPSQLSVEQGGGKGPRQRGAIWAGSVAVENWVGV